MEREKDCICLFFYSFVHFVCLFFVCLLGFFFLNSGQQYVDFCSNARFVVVVVVVVVVSSRYCILNEFC